MHPLRRAIRPSVLAGGAAIALTLAGAAAAQTTTAEARGEALVTSHCARCHATGRDGDSPNPQAPLFRRLHERYPVENLEEALVEGIRVSHPPMPRFQFSPQDAQDIIAYLQSVQADPQAKPAKGAPPAPAPDGPHR